MRSSLATSEPSMKKSSEAKRVQVRLGWLDFLLGQAYAQPSDPSPSSALELQRKKAWKHCVPMKRNSKRCSKNSKGCRKN
jgi:hypothetical protein